MDKYQEMFAQFNPINPEQAQTRIDKGEELIVFVGRVTCPYCRKFVRKLIKVKDNNPVEILYMDTEDEEHLEATQAFRDKYDIPTVPGLLYAKEGNVQVKADSSMKIEEIESFIGL